MLFGVVFDGHMPYTHLWLAEANTFEKGSFFMSNTNARDNLVNGNIVKTMLSLSIPAILGMVVIGLYNFMDAA